MLDLTLQKELYKIKWVDGSVLHIKPPTQKQYLEIQSLQDEVGYLDVITTVYDLTQDILNKNIEGKEISSLDELGLDTCLLVLQDYFNFYQKQMESKVVFPPTQQQTVIR